MGVMSMLDLEYRQYDGGLPDFLLESLRDAASYDHTDYSEATASEQKKKKKMGKGKRYDNSDIVAFCRSIAASPSFADSCKQIYIHDKKEDKFRRLVWFRQNSDFDQINSVEFRATHDYYVTKNSFFAQRRGSDYIFCFDNIVIDCDNHGKISKQDLSHEIDRLIFLLQNDYQGDFPRFNAVRSGRGVQLWIGLDSFYAKHTKLIFIYSLICQNLCDRLNEIITENNIKLGIDYSASTNAAGVVRLPYTYNTKSNTLAAYEHLTDERYAFADLLTEFPIIVSTSKRQKRDCSEDESKYAPLHNKRMRYIKQLVEHCDGDCEGRRDIMIFLYYNAAMQIYDGDTAKSMTKSLNQQFVKPLKDRGIDKLMQWMDKHGAYYYHIATFVNVVAVSEHERQMYYFCTDDRATRRKEAREAKAQRNQKIAEMQAAGCSVKDIAEQAGCCERTVASVTAASKAKAKEKRNQEIIRLQAAGFTRQEIADKVGCSKRTVANVLADARANADQNEVQQSEQPANKTICVSISPVVYQSRAYRRVSVPVESEYGGASNEITGFKSD